MRAAKTDVRWVDATDAWSAELMVAATAGKKDGQSAVLMVGSWVD